jgi:conjugal transfer pilus assembly protein TraV
MINPYQSDFSCPDTFRGKCASVREVYLEDGTRKQKSRDDGTAEIPAAYADCASASVGEEGGGTPPACLDSSPVDAATGAPSTGNRDETNFNRYRSALYDKFSGLLREPKTPVVAPPKVMRVLLLPYTGQDNEFYMLRHVYFFVDKPRWILGDSVVADGEEE